MVIPYFTSQTCELLLGLGRLHADHIGPIASAIHPRFKLRRRVVAPHSPMNQQTELIAGHRPRECRLRSSKEILRRQRPSALRSAEVLNLIVPAPGCRPAVMLGQVRLASFAAAGPLRLFLSPPALLLCP